MVQQASLWLCWIYSVFHRSAQCQLKFTDIQTSIKDIRKTVAKLGDWKRALERQEAEEEVEWSGGSELCDIHYLWSSIPSTVYFPQLQIWADLFYPCSWWYDASVLQCASRTPDDLMWQSAGVSYQSSALSENGRLYLRLRAS